MLRARSASAAALLGAALAVAGCGGSERKDAVAAAERWLTAVGDADTDAACDLMHESAVMVLRRRSGLKPAANCAGVVRAYAGACRDEDIDGILEIGLEAEGTVKNDELGVFPVSGPRELQVILMRRAGDGWKVASTSLGPTEPEPTPTPEQG